LEKWKDGWLRISGINLPVGRIVFPASHGTSKKSRNVENKDIDFVNE
jgi:hypothetical protein